MRRAVLALLVAVFVGSSLAHGQAIQVRDLRCEYLKDPKGIDTAAPRLSWVIRSQHRGQRQTAYQLLVAASPAALKGDQGDVWDSGKVVSDETAQIVYAGRPLASRQICYWKVRAWDGDGQPSPWSRPARWEMGLLKPTDWSAQWIEAGLHADEAAAPSLSGAKWIWCPEPGLDLTKSAPAGDRYFRCRVTLPAGEIPAAARLILTVDDQFTLFVNGKQIGQFAQMDGWKQPQRYDLLAHLQSGENVVAVVAKNIESLAGVCAKIAIQYPGEQPRVIVSDRNWKTSKHAADGWNTANFNDSSWHDSFEIAAFGEGVWQQVADGSAAGPVPILHKSFALGDKPVASARLYATALGLYEIRINGKRVGDHVLAPDWTDYRKRVRYQVYDVASLLKQGDNAMAALLGNGWYCGHIGNNGFQFFGKVPALLAQLEVTYSDGSVERVVSDASWKIHASPILASDFMLGESYDATKAVPGWASPGLDASSWPVATVRHEHARLLEGQVMQGVRQTGKLKPKSISQPKPGQWVFDMGQNMVGVVRLTVSAPAGTKLTLRHAEMLNPDGTLYTTNLRGAASVDTYVCKGGGVEVWQPTFAFHGFRYVELTGLPAKPEVDAVTGIVLGTDIPRTGEFTCSDPRINQLYSNIWWGQRGNYLSIPTDCPQRDERLGWMGDALVFVRTAAMNADVAAFFTKWLVDVDDGQSPDGAFSDVNPNTMGCGSVPAWADAGVICPWTIYQVYGDRRILERHLPAMTRWVEWCRKHSTDLIRDKDRGNDYGDWLSIGADTPKDVIGTAYFAYSTDLVARSYKAIGNETEAAKYEKLFHEIKAAFNKRYVKSDGRITGNTQCCYAMALKFDLLPEGLRPKAVQYLEDDIKAKGWHLSTGFVGVSYLLPVLTQAGKVDTAYRLLMQDSFPSWLFSVKHGATTIWERWDGWTPERGFQDPGMNSFNHYSLGSGGQWLFDSAAGIGLDPEKPGFRHIIIHPRVGGGLTSASATLRSIQGLIVSSWAMKDGTCTLDVTIPVNTTATVYVPAANAAAVQDFGKPVAEAEGVKLLRAENGEAVFEVQSGAYRFTAQ
ncbi:MAG: family 78 glycoside hydrolase catalytic domain [Thermoguttaceae bacterium]